MANGYALSRYIDITVASRIADVSPDIVLRYMALGLVGGPLTCEDLVTLRRARRLHGLGVNQAGIEVILRMRRRIEELLVEMARLKALVSDDMEVDS